MTFSANPIYSKLMKITKKPHKPKSYVLDRRLFVLNKEQWEAFNEALDTPAKKNEKLAQLLSTKSPWE
jgi:uncharacterized protein (DUF1778 family)